MKKEEQMFALVEEFIGSGLSRTEFAKQHHVKVEKFDYWRKRYSSKKHVQPPVPSSSSQFIEIMAGSPKLKEQVHHPRIELELSTGITVRIF